MGLLDGILGAAGAGQAQDFLRRYDQGPPWAGISDDEARSHYEAVASRLSPGDYRDSAEAALAKLSPDERQALVTHLQQQARQQDVNFPGMHGQGMDDPRSLAGVLSSMHQQQPGLLQHVLGGGGGGAFQSPLAKAALAGIAAMGIRKMMGR